MENITRRRFLEFMGRGAAVAMGASLLGPMTACSMASKSKRAGDAAKGALGFTPVSPSFEDRLLLPEGFRSSILIGWGDTINGRGEKFGFNNDYTAFVPLREGSTDDGFLWVNHEYPDPTFVSRFVEGARKTRAQVVMEMEAVGGSILRIRKDASGRWQVVPNDPHNRRITGMTPIPMASVRPIQGARIAVGTMANCAGGITPWGTILTCEENYQEYYGETDPEDPKKKVISYVHYDWQDHFDHPPEHYGWVVEVNPRTGQARKLTALGRFSHECATNVLAKDGRVAVYSGDDAADQCLYKFISDKPGSLERGTLYVANLEKGRWIPLDLRKNPELHRHFKDQTDLLIHARKAAHLVGGTPLDRPEDVERDPITGAMLIALTNNKARKNYYGSLLKIVEKDNDPLALEFEASTYLHGGAETGFACPDNLAFDAAGNLWFCTDMSGYEMGNATYGRFGNNGLFMIPMSGPMAGQAVRVASAPKDAELTGPTFSPDGKTLFLSVQHPGEQSKRFENPTSHWPDGGNSTPRPCVVTISGPSLERVTGARSS